MSLKKSLLTGTTALVTASLLSCSAMASSPTVTFKGGIAYDYLSMWNSSDKGINSMFGDVTGASKTAWNGDVTKQHNGFAANHSLSNLQWLVDGRANNGLQYGANIIWRYTNGGGAGALREASVYLGADRLGRVVVGQTVGADSIVPYGSADVEASPGMDAVNEQNSVHTVAMGVDGSGLFGITAVGSASHVNQIAYYTPNFSGFQAGISFAPSLVATGDVLNAKPADGDPFAIYGVGGVSKEDAYKNRLAYASTFAKAFKNSIAYALSYQADAGPVNVHLGAAYFTAQPNKGFNVASHTTSVQKATNYSGTLFKPLASYLVGGDFAAYGAKLGLVYFNNGKSGCLKNPTADYQGCSGGDGYGAGVGYQLGNLYVATEYQYRQDKLNGGVKEFRQISAVNGEYKLFNGVSVYGQVAYDFSKNHMTAAKLGVTPAEFASYKNKNAAVVYTVGTHVTF